MVPAAVAQEGSLVRSVKAVHNIVVALKTLSARQTSHLAAPLTAQDWHNVEHVRGHPAAFVADAV